MKAFRYLLGLFIGSALLCSTLARADTATFLRSLRLGMSGTDVLKLQQLLNQDVRTQIASTGIGSLGQETTYFGRLTYTAVVRFQELYRSEVLSPVGLVSGTGYVGPSTLRKLNAVALGAAPAAVPVAGAPTIVSLSPTRTTVSGTILVTGIGFDIPPVTVTIGGIQLTPYVTSDATQLSFRVPTGLTPGLQDIVVSNGRGTSNHLKIHLEDAAGAATTSGPSISQLSPSSGGYGTTVTITGSGFSQAAENGITTGYDQLTGVASPDGKTLRFTIPQYIPQLNFTPEQLSGLDASLPFWIYVQVGDQESVPALFTFTFYNN